MMNRLTTIQFSILTVMMITIFGCGSQNKDASNMVKNGSDVTITYSLKANGVDVIPANKPQEFKLKVGAGIVPKGLENGMIGMVEGKTKVIKLTESEAFGPIRQELLAKIPRSSLPENVSVGMQVNGLKDTSGATVSARVARVDDEFVVVDRNHPLAGKNVEYRIKLISIDTK